MNPIKVGDTLSLVCCARGLPSPTIALYKDGIIILKNPEELDKLNYTVTSAKLKDNGTYTCNASSTSRVNGRPYPVATKSIEVVVQGEIVKFKTLLL